MVPYSFYPLFFHLAAPWKLPFYRNFPLFLLFLANVIASIVFFFTTKQLQGAFGMEFVEYKVAGIAFLIIMITVMAGGIFNYALDTFEKKSIRMGEGSFKGILSEM